MADQPTNALIEPLITQRQASHLELDKSFRQAQHSLRLALINMGIEAESVEAAIAVYELTDVDRALQILIKSSSGWNHLFIPSDAQPEVCMICKETFDQHKTPDAFLNEHTPMMKSMRSSVLSDQPSLLATQDVCGICYQECVPYPGLLCGHEVCETCLREYLESEIKESRVLDVRCPYANCGIVLQEVLIKSVVSPPWFEKYQRFKQNQLIASNPNARWCPSPTCDHVILYGSANKPYLRCDLCGTELCFLCGERWHPNTSCEEATDKSYEQWAKGKNIQLCPQCRRRIEKDTGCNHMACASCGYQWCWLCRERYSDMHFSPLNPFGCPGLQGAEHTRERWPWYKRWLLRLGILVLFPFSKFQTVVIFGVPLILTYKALLVLEETGFSETCTSQLIKYCCVVPMVFALGVLFTPFVLLISSLPLLCFVLYQGAKYVSQLLDLAYSRYVQHHQ